MTKLELEKEIAAEFPSFSPVAVECLASSVMIYHSTKNELSEATKELDSLKQSQDSSLRLECLKLAESMFPNISFDGINEEDTSAYHCRIPKYRTELAEKYFNYLKTGESIEILTRFYDREDWPATSSN